MPIRNDYQYAVKMVSLNKFFGNIQALKNINFEVGASEIVGLIGDNGAGKSTLIKIMTGVFPPSSGEIYIKDKLITLKDYSVRKAHCWGIETVYQDRSLGEKQDLWRNFFVGRNISNPFGFIKVKEEKAIAQRIMMETIGFRGVGISVNSRVNKLSGGERQGVAIGRAMHFEADLIVLDEPTVALSLKEVKKVLNFVGKIKKSNKACVYISHSLNDVYEISDRFVILDRGKIVSTLKKADISLKDLDEYLLTFAYQKREEEE